MKKHELGIVAAVVIGIVALILSKDLQTKYITETQQVKVEVDAKDADDEGDNDADEYFIRTLSDGDIYFEPDTVVPKNAVLDDMMDVANGYAILRAVCCDAELWFRFGVVVNNEIAQIKTDVIKDDVVRHAAVDFVKTITNILPRDTTLWDPDDDTIWKKVSPVFRSFGVRLRHRYALERYGTIDDKKAAAYLSPRSMMSNYDSIYSLRIDQSEQNERFLLKMVEQASDFDKQCLYAVEYAHQNRYAVDHPAIPVLERLMKQGKASRYLHIVWRTWRYLCQFEVSLSRDGVILNQKYNKMRLRCMRTIFRQICKNPKDIWAINDFCYLATFNNIVRICDSYFGNSVLLEQMDLFPEVLIEDDETEDDETEEDE